MYVPRIQTLSPLFVAAHARLRLSGRRLEGERDRFGAVVVGAGRRTSSCFTAMPSLTCSGSGGMFDEVAPSPMPPPSRSTSADTYGTGTPGTPRCTIVNERTLPVVASLRALELGAAALGVGVAPVEVERTRVDRLPRDEVRRAVVDAPGSRRSESACPCDLHRDARPAGSPGRRDAPGREDGPTRAWRNWQTRRV